MRLRAAPSGLGRMGPEAGGAADPVTAPGQTTHELSLTSVDGVAREVERLLRAAYGQNG